MCWTTISVSSIFGTLDVDAGCLPLHLFKAKPKSGPIHVSVCQSCFSMTFWQNAKIIFPSPIGIEPNKDMPTNVRELFVEAQRVTYLSPRSACALLRVSLERLADHVAELRGVSDYRKDAKLFQKLNALSLPTDILAICNTIRAVGNSSAHGNTKAAEIDFTGEDSVDVALKTAQLINALVILLVSPFVVQKELLAKFGK